MKIIGKTQQGLLLSATKDELANMVGFYYSGLQGCPEFNPGVEIELHKMYSQLRSLQQNEKELGAIATKLRMVADLLQLNDPIVQEKINA